MFELQSNVGPVDSRLRTAVGAAMIAGPLLAGWGARRTAWMAGLGALMMAEGISGYCLGYDLLGISTRDSN